MRIPRFMIAAPSSGSGKTMITCGILQLLINQGYHPASFKCGPDYIDPMFHSKVIGAKSRNLDLFFTGPERTRMLLAKGAEDCDISVIEGVMGYFDGIGADSSEAGASDLAEKTDTPVFLIVPVKGVSLSIVPMIKGFLDFQKKQQIRGVILNKVSPMMYPRMKKMIEEQLHIPVVGYVPLLTDIHLESRHLGLVMPDELSTLREELQRLAKILEGSLELDDMLEIARSAPDLDDIELERDSQRAIKELRHYYTKSEPLRIAVARDEAFCFTYADNLQLLQEQGAELIPFSPLRDTALPDGIDGLILHGGYPELYAKQLSENVTMRHSIWNAITKGLPTIAECGGFLYLHEQLADIGDHLYPMGGYFHGAAHYTGKLQRFGYITLTEGRFMGRAIGDIRAHEFHYYDSDDYGEDFLAVKPSGNRSWKCVRGSETLYAGFPHLYFYANPAAAGVFLQRCREYHDALA